MFTEPYTKENEYLVSPINDQSVRQAGGLKLVKRLQPGLGSDTYAKMGVIRTRTDNTKGSISKEKKETALEPARAAERLEGLKEQTT
jgi:hypothetical protein